MLIYIINNSKHPNMETLMPSQLHSQLSCSNQFFRMLQGLSRRFRSICSRIRWLVWRPRRPKLVIRRLNKLRSKGKHGGSFANDAPIQRPIRLASFNAALFSLAPAVPKAEKSVCFLYDDDYLKINDRPKSILKHSPLHPMVNDTNNFPKRSQPAKPRPKVSINLPDNEISLAQNKVLNVVEDSSGKIFGLNRAGLALMRSPICLPAAMMANLTSDGGRTIFDVLKEVDADVLALQDVKAVEEKDMKPLSDLASALGMNYVFAESWAPEYGNAILSKWPIKRWKVQKIYDANDFRNVIKATIDVPWMGELSFYGTQLDHLDENWRMKQIDAIFESNDQPHVLAGGLNSLDGSDYSSERWGNIVKYYEEIGKPTPRVDVMKLLKRREYRDAKDFTGECEPVVIIAKGQNVQGTCKYGTRVDYILASPGLPYKFVPGSYSVISSKGTSDHHIVKVDIVKAPESIAKRRRTNLKQSFLRINKGARLGEEFQK